MKFARFFPARTFAVRFFQATARQPSSGGCGFRANHVILSGTRAWQKRKIEERWRRNPQKLDRAALDRVSYGPGFQDLVTVTV